MDGTKWCPAYNLPICLWCICKYLFSFIMTQLTVSRLKKYLQDICKWTKLIFGEYLYWDHRQQKYYQFALCGRSQNVHYLKIIRPMFFIIFFLSFSFKQKYTWRQTVPCLIQLTRTLDVVFKKKSYNFTRKPGWVRWSRPRQSLRLAGP